jgi:hypothetical protein
VESADVVEPEQHTRLGEAGVERRRVAANQPRLADPLVVPFEDLRHLGVAHPQTGEAGRGRRRAHPGLVHQPGEPRRGDRWLGRPQIAQPIERGESREDFVRDRDGEIHAHLWRPPKDTQRVLTVFGRWSERDITAADNAATG